jgi:hypothetical protein
MHFGFMEKPDVLSGLSIARSLGWQFDLMSTSFFLSRRTLTPADRSGMPRGQDMLFIAIARTANDATDYSRIPTDRVVEVGTQVTIRCSLPGPADQECRRHQYAAVRRRAVAVSLRSATINDQVGRCALRNVTAAKLPCDSYPWQFDKAHR